MGEKGKEELNKKRIGERRESKGEKKKKKKKKKSKWALFFGQRQFFSSFSPNAGPGPRLGM